MGTRRHPCMRISTLCHARRERRLNYRMEWSGSIRTRESRMKPQVVSGDASMRSRRGAAEAGLNSQDFCRYQRLNAKGLAYCTWYGRLMSIFFGGKQARSLQAWYRNCPTATPGPAGAFAVTLKFATMLKSPVNTDKGLSANSYFSSEGLG